MGECSTTEQHPQTPPGSPERALLWVSDELFFGGEQELPGVIINHLYLKVPMVGIRVCSPCYFKSIFFTPFPLSRSLENKEGLGPVCRVKHRLPLLMFHKAGLPGIGRLDSVVTPLYPAGMHSASQVYSSIIGT